MEDRHLPLLTMARLVTGRIEVEELQEVVIPHVLAVCAGCREIYQELQRLKQEVGHWDEIVAVMEGPDAPDLWQRLQGLPYEQQLRQVEEDGGLQTWALCRLLLRKSLEEAPHRPDLAEQVAFLAVIAKNLRQPGQRLDAQDFGFIPNEEKEPQEQQEQQAGRQNQKEFVAPLALFVAGSVMIEIASHGAPTLPDRPCRTRLWHLSSDRARA